MNTIKDIQVDFIQPPNSLISDYSAMVKTIMSEIVNKCAVPEHLMGKDKFTLWGSSMRRQGYINDILVKLSEIKSMAIQ